MRLFSTSLLPFAASLVFAQTVAVPKAGGKGYTQTVTASDGTLEIRTAAQRFVAPGKPVVWLVGAMHVGRRSYYESLQRLLGFADTVFYEGVKPGAKEEATAPPDPSLPVAAPTHKVFGDALGLDFQQERLDYLKPGWKNVDLTMDQLDALNRAQSEADTSKFDLIKKSLDPNSEESKQMARVLKAATPGMCEAIKIFMLKTLGTSETPTGLGTATDRIVIQERNKIVIDAIDGALTSPQPPRSIAVLYGAGHMADLQAILVGKYGYALDEKRWFPVAQADPRKLDDLGKMLLERLEEGAHTKERPATPR